MASKNYWKVIEAELARRGKSLDDYPYMLALIAVEEGGDAAQLLHRFDEYDKAAENS